jgi:hypothetical protein
VLREKRLECKASGVVTRADGQQSRATKKVTLKAPKKARRH